MRNLTAASFAVAVATLTFAACGSDADDTAAQQTSPPTAPAATTQAAPTTDDAATPSRIVSLSPSLTEMLFAIDAGDRVIAVDEHSDFPADAPRSELSGFSPNVEAIAELQPDLVVLASDRDGVVAALDAVGIPSVVLERAATIDDTYAQIEALGAATGHEPEAAALVASMRQQVDDIVARVPERGAPLSYFYEVSDDGHSATSETFIGNVLGLAGLRSIADGVDDAAGGFPQLSSEYVLEQDPDLIFLAHADGSNPTPADLAARPGWSELSAVAGGAVVELDPDLASRWGPRLVELLDSVVESTADR